MRFLLGAPWILRYSNPQVVPLMTDRPLWLLDPGNSGPRVRKCWHYHFSFTQPSVMQPWHSITSLPTTQRWGGGGQDPCLDLKPSHLEQGEAFPRAGRGRGNTSWVPGGGTSSSSCAPVKAPWLHPPPPWALLGGFNFLFSSLLTYLVVCSLLEGTLNK